MFVTREHRFPASTNIWNCRKMYTTAMIKRIKVLLTCEHFNKDENQVWEDSILCVIKSYFELFSSSSTDWPTKLRLLYTVLDHTNVFAPICLDRSPYFVEFCGVLPVQAWATKLLTNDWLSDWHVKLQVKLVHQNSGHNLPVPELVLVLCITYRMRIVWFIQQLVTGQFVQV